MQVAYKGPKKIDVPVWLPIGVKRMGQIKETKWIAKGKPIDLPEADAKALVQLDPINFELVAAKVPKAVDTAPVVEGVAPKKRGRPKKAE